VELGTTLPRSRNDASGEYDQLKRAFQHAAAGCAVTNTKGKCVTINSAFARVLALEEGLANEANIFELIHPEDQSKHQLLLDQLLAGEIPDFIIEKRYVRPDGSVAWVRNSVSLLNTQAPSEQSVIHICEDISDKKQLERTVEAQGKLALLGGLASSIVHEIANPLESLRYLIYLANKSAISENVRSYLQSAENEIDHIAEIIAQTLEFHRQAPDPSRVDANGLLKSVMTMFNARLKRHMITVRIDETDGVMLTCFPSEIRQVVANLISNAIDAMQKGGALRLKASNGIDWNTGGRLVRITIADTGTGMNAQTQKHMYESFYTTKGASGSGIGLWVSANIVKRHHGSIHVRSTQGPHETGTVFAVSLPVEGIVSSAPDISKMAS
jgi:PAS domain S-box-containing protein